MNITAIKPAVREVDNLPFGVKGAAIDLYERGFNVFPLPLVSDWNKRIKDGDKNKKPPFDEGTGIKSTETLFNSRLHYCGMDCHHVKRGMEFVSLFERANIGVILGKTSGNLLQVDCDTAAAMDQVGLELDRRKLPYWSINSFRGGSYFLRIVEGEAANMAKGYCSFANVELWGNKHYAVLPPSIHPGGTSYSWRTPEPREGLPRYVGIAPVSIYSLDWLGAKLAKQHSEKIDIPDGLEGLSIPNIKALAGVQDGGRHNAGIAIARDMAGNQVDEYLAMDWMYSFAERCEPPLPAKDVESILKNAYRQPRKPARGYHLAAGASLSFHDQVVSFADTFDWRAKYGRKAGTRKRVFKALVDYSKRTKERVFRASVREIGDMANMATKGTWSIIQDLLKDNFIEKVGSASAGSGLFRFGSIVCSEFTTVIPLERTVVNSEQGKTVLPVTDAEKNLFGELGANTFPVWRHLLNQPEHSIGDISSRLDISRTSAFVAVKRLMVESIMLVTYSQAEHMYIGELRTDAELANIVIRNGMDDKVSKRRELYKLQREVYANRRMFLAREAYHAIDKVRR